MKKTIQTCFTILLTVCLLFHHAPIRSFAQTTESGENALAPVIQQAKPREYKSNKELVGEDLSKRERNIKHFFKDDFSYEAVLYPTTVHVKENGAWVDIDNSLTEQNVKGEQVYKNKKNSYSVILSKTSTSKQLVQLSQGSYEISFSLLDAQSSLAQVALSKKDEGLSASESMKVLRKLSSTIAYDEVFKGVSLRYTILPERLKEDIVLASVDAIQDFRFIYQTKNLSMEEFEGQVVFKDTETGKEIFFLEPPHMMDSAGEISTDITMQLTKSEEGMILTLRPDEAWLKDAKRVYPVIIDPVVTTSLNSADINDVHVSKGYPTTNYIYSTILKTGWGTSSDVNRIYFRFLNLPTLSSADMVTDAVFTLTQKTSHTSAARQLNLVEVIEDWNNSTLIWNDQPQLKDVIADYTMMQGSSGTSHQWNITRLVQQWYNSGINHGFMLEDHAPGTTSASYNEYHSSEASASRPMVIISYRNTSGLEPYWTYRSQSIGRAGTVYTQDVTGNLVLVHSDAGLSGNRMPIAIRHVYNSNDLSNMGYGKGFRLNIHQEVSTVVVGSITYYRYIDGDGTSHYFPKVGTSPYEDEDGLGYQLVENTASTTARYVITDKDDNKMEFNSVNDLVKIIDRNNNTMTITYTTITIDDVVVKVASSVSDGSGRTMTLTYSGNILQKITDVAGRHIQYSYTGGNLTQITYPDLLVSTYAYSASLLTSVKNHDGYELVVDYSDSLPKRVISLTEKNGATLGTTLSMTYGDNFTTFKDFNNRSLQLQFTDWGHTGAKVNDLGYAQYYKFFDGASGAAANKLNSVSKLQQSITNALFNSGGESGDTGWSDVHGSGSSATVDITTADKFLGNYSLRVSKTNTTSFSQHSQTLTLTKGQTYTLSSRIKTDSVSSANQGGAWLEASYKNSSGTYVAVNSSPLSGSQDWMKQSITFTIPSNATDGTVLIRMGIKNETGTAYFDNVQVEEGDVANRYNLLSNSGFTSGLTGWTHSGGSIVSLTGRLNVSTQALQIIGSASLDRFISQDVNIGGSSGDVYTFGGWAKADSVPTNTTKIFDVTVEFYNGTTLVNRVSVDFNPSFKNWQYVSGAAIASGTYTKVRLLARYHKNLNTVAFDDLALFKETFSTSYQYDANGNVISTQQLSNETNGMQYNANDDLVKLTDEIGGQFLYTYDSKHNLLSALSASNVNYTMSYDAYGNNTSLTTKTNLIAYYSFDGNNLNDSSGNNYHGTNFGATFATGRFGNAIVFNGTSQWAQLTDFPVGDNFSISMWVKPHSTADGQLILGKHDISGNNIWLYGYWENGIHTRIRSLTTTGGTKYSNEYRHHLLTFEKISDTSTKVSVYINGGIPVYQTTLNQPIHPTAGKPWVLAQDWDGSGISDYFDGEIDELAFFSGIIKPDQIKTTSGGALDIAAYKTFVSTSATTESNGQYTDKVTDALGNVTDTNWDAYKGFLTSSIDAKNVTTTYTYHTNNDKLTTVSSGDAIVSYGYTGDQLSSITRNGFSYGFTFDSLGNPTSVKMGTTPLITHSYQARTSRLTSSLYANGGKVSYNYDTLDRVIGVTIDNELTPQFEYRYDASGNLAIVKDNLRSITTYLEYDLANRLSKITDSQGHAITYAFDAKNRLSGATEVLKGTTYTSSYTYNADNQPATVSADGKTHSYTYDLLGRLSGTSLNTDTPYTTALTYKSNPSTGSSSHVLNSYRSGSTTTTYQVDANGNITQLSDGTYTYTYVYDDFNQLERENNPLLNKSITYQYDVGGNLEEVKEYAYTTGTLVNPTSTVVYTYGSAWKDQLTSIGADNLTYDTNGNLLSYKTRSYSWQAGRQLAQITDTNLNAVYTYNESGIRTRKVVNGVTTDYLLEGGKVILETTGNDALHYSYDSRGQLVSFKLNGTPYFYTRNGQGDITGLIDASGTEVVRYTYDSWGKPISITGSLALTVGAMNPYRYRGYRYDTESGLYYLQSRYYDPSIKRFISADSQINEGILGANLFTYSNNNPVNEVDPSGRASYKNTILHNEKENVYEVTTSINISKKRFLYKYTVTSLGVIEFSFETNDYLTALLRGIANTLSEAIYKAAKSINKNFIWGRSSNGINFELQIHFYAFRMGIKKENSRIANIGSLIEDKIGYDSNAYVFEAINYSRIIVKFTVWKSLGMRYGLSNLYGYNK